MRRYKWVLIIASILIVFGLSGRWLQGALFVPIEVVKVTEKLQYSDPAMIKQAVVGYMQDGFLGLNVVAIRRDLKQLPWVADANVQRCWPNMVKIKIFERQPLAVWQKQGVIDTEGKLFFPPNIGKLADKLAGLPEFVGTKEDLDAMVDMYLLILSALKPIGLAVKKLEIMLDHGWRAILDNGMVIVLGQVELEERLRRFVLAYPVLAAESKGLAVVDLRYTNGLSVG